MATGTQAIAAPQAAELLSGPAPAVGAAAETEGMGFADFVRVLKQRRLMIVITSVVIYMLVVLATFITYKYFPGYLGEAIYEMEPPTRGDLRPEEDPVNPQNMEVMLQTEARKLKQMDLLLAVVQQPEIKNTHYYRWYGGEATRAANGLKDDLVCAPIMNSQLIRVALVCQKKSEAPLIVNTVTRLYEEKYRQKSRDETFSQVESLKKTRDELIAKLNSKREEISRFRATTDVPALEASRSAAKEYTFRLKAQLSQYDTWVANLQAQLESLAGMDPMKLPLNAEQQLIIESDPVLRYWRSQVEGLDVEIEATLKLVGPNHRQVQILEQRRRGFLEKEAAKREELVDQVRRRQYEQLRQELASTQRQQLALREQLEEAEAKERDLEGNAQRFKQMLDDEQSLLRQIEEVERTLVGAEHGMRDAPNRVRLRLVQSAKEAIKPSRPNLPIFLGGGFVLAIVGGIGLAFLREITDTAVRTPVDVARFGRLSVLGTIPLLDDEEADVEEVEHAARVAPHSLIAEAFRKVRTNIQFSGPAQSQRILLITSGGPEDGKTTVAVNLAVTMAQASQRVLLIDCNFRRPAIRRIFQGTRPDGLSNVLTGQATLDALVTPCEVPNLFVLTSGPMPPTPAELLGSLAMRRLLDEAAQKFDRVILDGPPALLISDAIVLALQVDGVIVVARAEINRKGALKRVREQLESINARVVGAVLNGVKAKAGGYFRKHYREFYEYTSDETIPVELPGVTTERPALDVSDSPADEDEPRRS